jgi:hypothetical protein
MVAFKSHCAFALTVKRMQQTEIKRKIFFIRNVLNGYQFRKFDAMLTRILKIWLHAGHCFRTFSKRESAFTALFIS